MGKRYILRRLSRIKPGEVSFRRGIILLSAGIDSTVTLYLAKKYGYKLTALIFDYNQRHKREIRQAEKISTLNNVNYRLVKINLGWVKSSLTKKNIRIPSNRDLAEKKIPSTYVPGRNIIFLSYAVSLAESFRIKNIFIGAHIEDYSGYPDCRPEFLDSFQEAVNSGIKEKPVKIIAPLIDKSKKEIIKLGVDLGVPFGDTWSCYEGGKFPCKKCDSCRFRMRAFKSLGIKDPLLRHR